MKFKIGQKVVALRTACNNMGDGIKKDEIYPVLGDLECTCGNACIDVGIKTKRPSKGIACGKCEKVLTRDSTVAWADEDLFEAIIEIKESFRAISYEKVVEEVPISVN